MLFRNRKLAVFRAAIEYAILIAVINLNEAVSITKYIDSCV